MIYKTRLLEDEYHQEITNHSKMKPIRPLDATVALGGFTKDNSKKVMCLIISCYPREAKQTLTCSCVLFFPRMCILQNATRFPALLKFHMWKPFAIYTKYSICTPVGYPRSQALFLPKRGVLCRNRTNRKDSRVRLRTSLATITSRWFTKNRTISGNPRWLSSMYLKKL